MVKPSQATEDQLNAWVSSLSGDILTTNTTFASSNTKKEDKRHPRKKRQRNDEEKAVITKRPRDGKSINAKKRQQDEKPIATKKSRDLNEDTPLPVSEQEVTTLQQQEKSATTAGLRALAMNIENSVDLVTAKYRKPYEPEKAPKASVSKRKLNLQPRKSDYGGIGLAQESIYIRIDESGWKKKLCKRFLEHIPGFFGKQRTKAMKKQMNGAMLWRQRLAMKQQSEQSIEKNI